METCKGDRWGLYHVYGAERNMAAKRLRPGTASRGKGLPCSIAI